MISTLTEMIQDAKRGVFFGGAGVSTESNIPDFRSADGLYSKMRGRYASPEEILSFTFFANHTAEFFEFYKKEILAPYAQPNRAHYALARMEQDGKLKAVITQNIDGLHTKAGSRIVYEVHGSTYRNYCMDCTKQYDMDFIINSPDPVPVCTRCGGVVRPDVTLYEEALPADVLEQSAKAVREADLFIVGGTSLVVYPAAGLLRYFTGKNLVIINREPTQFDNRAALIFRESIGEVLNSAWPEKT
ncbi:MAG: NAD-dependent protein deacylase [Bacillota bacterium]